MCLVKFMNVPKGTEQLVIQNVWFQFMETKVASSNKFQERMEFNEFLLDDKKRTIHVIQQYIHDQQSTFRCI